MYLGRYCWRPATSTIAICAGAVPAGEGLATWAWVLGVLFAAGCFDG